MTRRPYIQAAKTVVKVLMPGFSARTCAEGREGSSQMSRTSKHLQKKAGGLGQWRLLSLSSSCSHLCRQAIAVEQTFKLIPIAHKFVITILILKKHLLGMFVLRDRNVVLTAVSTGCSGTSTCGYLPRRPLKSKSFPRVSFISGSMPSISTKRAFFEVNAATSFLCRTCDLHKARQCRKGACPSSTPM